MQAAEQEEFMELVQTQLVVQEVAVMHKVVMELQILVAVGRVQLLVIWLAMVEKV